ncbi:hypothetical protein ONA91_35330 [Micromonospora sp. DR5-3]|uniref:hypothetical protein n=1 Tax=unclassified Micromonospora TaxID=2617518 RepID=UPI0011D8F469|nr:MULTISPECIES: hypothetical protein [unclassified Micromonospora]MCW3819721.1 hypothetical protein [Micromonospora sp. DR5-3]TYC14927.1 hypothetical protein FXF52_39675 [Micromonospora sp. MP36]
MTSLRWWVASPEQVDEAVAQVVADLTAYGEPFLVGNQTLPKVIQTLLGRPKSQVEYGTLAVCLGGVVRLTRGPRHAGEVRCGPPGIRESMTETSIHNSTERFGN